MGTPYQIGLYGTLPTEALAACEGKFNFRHLSSDASIDQSSESSARADAILITHPLTIREQLALLAQLTEGASDTIPPCLVQPDTDEVETTLSLFDAGADDVIDPDIPTPELITRINKAITNRVANQQLKSQLKLANEIAMSAMTDTSDLGCNIQFLIDSYQCDNFDQLGQRLFQALDNYGLKCSLQIRGSFEEKDMERSGIARELESQLLSHFQAAGRFHQTGKRLFVNYGQVSLLVKNMPVDDEVRCGKIRDNIFALLQGADARVKALDDKMTVELEMGLLQQLSERMQQTLTDVESSFVSITNEIVTAAEDTYDQVNSALNHLGLSDTQEEAICNIMDHLIQTTNAKFNRGLQIDERNRTLLAQIGELMHVPKSELPEAIAKLQTIF